MRQERFPSFNRRDPKPQSLTPFCCLDDPIGFRAEVMEPGESFDQRGFELPLPPQVSPADAGQGELFGDDYCQPDSAERDRCSGARGVSRHSPPTMACSQTCLRASHGQARPIAPNENSLVDSERLELRGFASDRSD